MHSLIPLPAFNDNYFWLVHDQSGNAVVVDPGDAAPVERYLAEQNLTLQAILVTHHHPDHTGGIARLHQHAQVPVYGPAKENIPCMNHPLVEGDQVVLESPKLTLDVLEVPGHTLGHIAFFTQNQEPPWLFCGDTLFSGGCGRLFEGTPSQMLQSLNKLAALPPETLVCCAHEYTLANLAFAGAVIPQDPAIHRRTEEAKSQREQGKPTVPSTIDEECRSNVFLRSCETSVIYALEAHSGDRLTTAETRFAALRQWKDQF